VKKIAVFGKPGNGKSSLSKKLALATGIKVHHLDSILYRKNGEQIDGAIYDKEHENILSCDSWIIDGFDNMESFDRRIVMAYTLIYIDLPYVVSYWLVTKRFLKSLFAKPEGWPDGCSVLKGTIQSYKVLKSCRRFWNKDLLQKLEDISKNKSLYVIRSISELNRFVEENRA
jgi:adenylate kinase family enzyme